MRDKLAELIRELEPEIQELVANVILIERDHIDMKKPRGIVQKIRDEIDASAQKSLMNEDL